jgi:hypothetical protein
VRRADNLTTLMCRLSRNPGALTSRTPQGHVSLFRGYFTLFRQSTCFGHICSPSSVYQFGFYYTDISRCGATKHKKISNEFVSLRLRRSGPYLWIVLWTEWSREMRRSSCFEEELSFVIKISGLSKLNRWSMFINLLASMVILLWISYPVTKLSHNQETFPFV